MSSRQRSPPSITKFELCLFFQSDGPAVGGKAGGRKRSEDVRMQSQQGREGNKAWPGMPKSRRK